MSQPDVKHFFLQPAMGDDFYASGAWQIFDRMAGLVAGAEVLTYRRREDGYRFLDDLGRDELAAATVWIYWHSHFPELAERLAGVPRVTVFSQAWDFAPRIPARWPVVCLSRYLAAEWSLLHPWRLVLFLGAALHPAARNLGASRDLDVVVHRRKGTPYLHRRLVPALAGRLRVEEITERLPQEDFFALLNRCRVYLYHFHRSIWGSLEGFGMQPLEAIACGAIPVSNAYGGLADYLEAPVNSRKIATWSLAYDVAQIEQAVREHDGGNPDQAKIRERYGEEAFRTRFAAVERALDHYFTHAAGERPDDFELAAPPPPWHRRAWYALYRGVKGGLKRARGVRPH